MILFNGALEITWYGGLKGHVRALLAENRKIGAIKYVREHRKWTLQRAKEYVDRIEQR